MMWIIVDDGDTFEGDENHWKNCFFSNPTEENIRKFCEENNMKVEIRYENPMKNGGDSIHE